jgi:hypothetical protein
VKDIRASQAHLGVVVDERRQGLGLDRFPFILNLQLSVACAWRRLRPVLYHLAPSLSSSEASAVWAVASQASAPSRSRLCAADGSLGQFSAMEHANDLSGARAKRCLAPPRVRASRRQSRGIPQSIRRAFRDASGCAFRVVRSAALFGARGGETEKSRVVEKRQ